MSMIAMGAGDTRGGSRSPRLRIVVNRDEERERPPAIPPRWHELEDAAGRPCGRAIWPIDPLGGGTWVGASERGLALLLLNGNPEPRPVRPCADRVLSRGGIIPLLIGRAGVDDAVAGALGGLIEFECYPAFRLVAAEPGLVRSVEWDGREARVAEHDPRACCFVSSGLGDRCVAVRLPLFDEMVRADPTPANQDRFHAHRWADRPELSVMMSRSAARTMSVTTVEVGAAAEEAGDVRAGASAAMWYRPVNEPVRVPTERVPPPRAKN
ncbi:MAG: hypothetical protein AB7Q91_11765 [Phycisphaerales bacterium]